MDLGNIIPGSTNGSLERRAEKQVFQSELKLLRGEQIVKRLEYGFFKRLEMEIFLPHVSHIV